jgi:tRNA threonylcarbamoyladenosine biosynthesis protein TsaE
MRYYSNMKKIVSNSPEETARIAAEWVKQVSATHPTRTEALVVGLSGNLGAGKTAFTKGVAQALGITEEITSPTFVIMKLYPTKSTSWKQLVHVDAYRLEKPAEVEVLGFEGLIADPGNLVLIEWPENIEGSLRAGENYLPITFSVLENDSDNKKREITFQ